MCGILGTINVKMNINALNEIKHRGPDDHGLFVKEIYGSKIYLGHQRLSIVDLSENGHQPMNSFSGKSTIIYNGEIYNHSLIRGNLTFTNFKGHSDTETLLELLEIEGENCLHKLNGIFAFAYLNKENKSLILARDPFGVKPLYYWISQNRLIFSSEIRSILNLSQDKEFSVAAISEALQFRFNPSPDTIYNNIKKVKPGHYIIFNFSDNNFEIIENNYVNIKQSGSKNYKLTSAVKRYGTLFENAVKRQLLSDVEVGVLLSGGIDSALVAYFAQKYTSYKLKAYTVGFSGNHESDEIQDASYTASILNLDHKYIKITFSDFLNTLKKISCIVEEPIATTSIIPMYYLTELASKDVKVVLTGQGADEPLGGYTRYKAELINQYFPDWFRRIFNPLNRSNIIKSERILRGLSSLLETDEINRFIKIYSIFQPIEIEQFIGNYYSSFRGKIISFLNLLELNKSKSVEKMMSIDMRLNLADDLLMYTDKISMHHSVEARVPLLDHELVTFIESLPYKYRLNLFKSKIIHKEFAKQVLPSEIINRKKKGFQSPTKYWFRKHIDELRQILLANTTSKFSTYFNLKYVENLLDQHLNGFNREKQIFLLLSFKFLMDE